MSWREMRTTKLYQFTSMRFVSSYSQNSLLRPVQNFPPENNYLLNATSIPLSTALQHYINSDSPSHGLKIHALILKIGFQPNTNIAIKLLILNLRCGFIPYARQVFDEMPHPTLSAYNYLIDGYVKQDRTEEIFSLVRHMNISGEKPDGFTFSLLLKAWTKCGTDSMVLVCDLGRQVHAQMVKSDLDEDFVLFTTLLDSYVKCGKIDYARRVFDMMPMKNVMSSTSMITGYMSKGCFEDAEDVFGEVDVKDVVVFNAMIEGYSTCTETAMKSIEKYIDMKRLGFLSTISTFASLFGACSLIAAFEVGQQVQGQLMKTKYYEDVKMGSALIDMYSKCGRIEDARVVFDYMPKKNVFSWTSMIDGYGKNGESDEALEMFDRMQKGHQIRPNYVTFLSALSACAHSGQVEKGQHIFESMEKDYSLKPRMEHYACMVDLLGRSGSIQKAWEFVRGMPKKPNSDVWAALLSSCRLHGEVEMAKVAADELFELCAHDRPGAYLALSNTLAAAGRWENVTELREMMKVKGVSKDTGFSWVGSDSKLGSFDVEHNIQTSRQAK